MEQLEIKGLVAKSADYGENDQLLTILSESEGKLFVTGKGLKSLKSKHLAACQLFTYSRFLIRKSKAYFYIVESEPIESFYPLREDFSKLALASYLCDVASELSLEGTPDEGLLRLTLNTLYALAYKKIPLWQIKSAYELRALSVSGYQPNLEGCCVCGKTTDETFFLDVLNGEIICQDCKYTRDKRAEVSGEETARLYFALTPPVLEAMRYVTFSPLERFLSFSLPNEEAFGFSAVCENYLLHQLERGFETLKYYKSFVG